MSTHPKRGADRYGMPWKSRSLLSAAPVNVPRGGVPAFSGAEVKQNAKRTLLTSISAAADGHFEMRLKIKEEKRICFGTVFRFAKRWMVLKQNCFLQMYTSGSGKRRKGCSACSTESDILSARGTSLEFVYTAPMLRKGKQLFEQNS